MFNLLTLTLCVVLHHTTASYTNIIPVRQVIRTSKTPSAPHWPVLPFDSDVYQNVQNNDIITENNQYYHRTSPTAPFHAVTLIGDMTNIPPNSYLVPGGYIISPAAIYVLTCDNNVTSCNLKKMQTLTTPAPVHQAVHYLESIYIATKNGLTIFNTKDHTLQFTKITNGISSLAISTPTTHTRAWNMPSTVLAAGNVDKLYLLNPSNGNILRWEWTTDTATEQGGVIDDRITSLLFTTWNNDDGALLIGNPTALNVMYSNGTFVRVDGDDGMPYGNITSMTATTNHVWFGTTYGLVMYDRTTVADAMADTVATSPWHYYNGARWLSGTNYITSVSPSALPCKEEEEDCVVTVSTQMGGLIDFRITTSTLLDRALQFQTIAEERHNRHGMISGCDMKSYGDVSSDCVSHSDDNNGLWTSLQVVAMYMKYNVTGDTKDADSASIWFQGIQLLNNVTGVTGLMGRSCCSPLTFNKTCGGHTHDAEHWHPSTNPNYVGWWWKGDTSSDEVAGHMFALSVVNKLSPKFHERELAKELLLNIVGGIVKHDYELIDITGNATTWGRWSPQYVNDFRGYSDERGLQSLQILSYLSAATNMTSNDPAGSASMMYQHAFSELTNATNQYHWNVLNQKIQAPDDNNYSDDELAWLPYFTWFFTSPSDGGGVSSSSSSSSPVTSLGRKIGLQSLKTSWKLIASERSALWSAIYYASIDAVDQRVVKKEIRSNILWNLQTWSNDLIDWPNDNSKRNDVIYESTETRFNVPHIESLKSRPPFPVNERRQYRWNANPYVMDPPGGTGMTEGDPGAWLLPYWMGRWSGVLSASD